MTNHFRTYDPLEVAKQIANIQPMTGFGDIFRILRLREFEGISQTDNDYEFIFSTVGETNDHIIHWLLKECPWTYTLYSDCDKFNSYYTTFLRFEDIEAAVVFKLRFA